MLNVSPRETWSRGTAGHLIGGGKSTRIWAEPDTQRALRPGGITAAAFASVASQKRMDDNRTGETGETGQIGETGETRKRLQTNVKDLVYSAALITSDLSWGRKVMRSRTTENKQVTENTHAHVCCCRHDDGTATLRRRLPLETQ